MLRYVACPACRSKLKYQGERSSVVCPKCKTRFSIASGLSTPVRQTSQLEELASLPEGLDSSPLGASGNERHDSSSSSQGIMVVGISVGIVVATIALVGATLFLSDGEPLQPPLADLGDEMVVAAALEPAPTRVVELAEQPTQVAEPSHLANPAKKNGEKNGEKTGRATSEQKREASEPAVQDTVEPSGLIETSLHYQWQTGRSYDYEFQLVVDLEAGKKTLTGNCTYSVGRVVKQLTEEELTATGTGFFVSEEGYLVTCAHVVQDAARVKVFLGKQEWEGKVVAVDQVQDLALVHVAARGVPTLLLSDASDVELAEPVRVVGFPLSNMLGKGIKITSGTVAGRTEEEEDGGRSFQIDASVNPGNSGGPIVDEHGRVVGVASALLSGIRISEVGFGVPAEQVHRLLKRAKVTATGVTKPKPQSGPELAKMVTPAVVYLEVVANPKARQTSRISYDFSYREETAPQATTTSAYDVLAREMRHGNLFPSRGNGRFAVTRYGQVSQYEGEGTLPYDLDRVGALAIEDLSHEGKSSWSTSTISEFSIREHGNPFQIPRHFGHQQGQRLGSLLEPKIKKYPAIERVSYQIVKETPDLVTLAKTYEFQTLEENDPPLFLQKGSGTLVFDKKIGMPVSLDYKSTVSARNDNGSVDSVPYTLSYKLRDSEEVIEEQVLDSVATAARHVGEAIARDSERKFGHKPQTGRSRRSVEPEPKSDPQRVDELIAIIKKRTKENGSRRQHGPLLLHELRELAKLDVVTKRQQLVGKIFLHYAKRPNAFDQRAAIEGLVKWATQKQVPGMIKLLTQEVEGIDWPERKEIIKALGRFKSPQVYRAIASRLIYFTEDDEAKEALIGFGSVAERAITEILDHKSEDARGSAAEILEEIGTKKSLPALKKALAEEPDHFTKRSIQDAIDAIQRRR